MSSLVHDVAWAGALAALDSLQSKGLLPNNHKQIHEILYRAFKAALEKYEELSRRQNDRMHPCPN